MPVGVLMQIADHKWSWSHYLTPYLMLIQIQRINRSLSAVTDIRLKTQKQ